MIVDDDPLTDVLSKALYSNDRVDRRGDAVVIVWYTLNRFAG